MKSSVRNISVLVGISLALLLGSVSAYAGSMPRRAVARRGGSYIVNPRVSQGLDVSVNMAYYYGDIEVLGLFFSEGLYGTQINWFSNAALAYHHPLGAQCNWRVYAAAGILKGNDYIRPEVQPDRAKHKGAFSSVFGQLGGGVEWYPFYKAGFYLYGGLNLTVSHIDYDYSPDYYRMLGDLKTGDKWTYLPMLHLELGYNFLCTNSFLIGLNVSCHQGLADTKHCSLDAWPVESTTRVQFGDGFFQVGLKMTFNWKKRYKNIGCQFCR